MPPTASKKASRKQNKFVRLTLICVAVVVAFYKFDQVHSNYSLSSHQYSNNHDYERDTLEDGGSSIETSSSSSSDNNNVASLSAGKEDIYDEFGEKKATANER